VTARTFLKHVCPAVGCPDQHLQGQVRVGADVPSVRGETDCSLWVIRQPEVVGCCPGVQALTITGCFAVTPVDMLAIGVTNIQAEVWERRNTPGVSRERESLQALKPFKFRENHVSCSALQSCNSPGDSARELFKRSADSASLVVEIEKKFFVFGGGFSEGTPQVGVFLATFTWP